MNTQTNPAHTFDDEEWEAEDNDPVENLLAAQAFAVAMGIPIEGDRIKPNHWLGEK